MLVQLLAHDWQRNFKNQQKNLSKRYINEKKIAVNGQQGSPYWIRNNMKQLQLSLST